MLGSLQSSEEGRDASLLRVPAGLPAQLLTPPRVEAARAGRLIGGFAALLVNSYIYCAPPPYVAPKLPYGTYNKAPERSRLPDSGKWVPEFANFHVTDSQAISEQ